MSFIGIYGYTKIGDAPYTLGFLTNGKLFPDMKDTEKTNDSLPLERNDTISIMSGYTINVTDYPTMYRSH